jgi:ribonucleoside-diphosphate reductase subunit M2
MNTGLFDAEYMVIIMDAGCDLVNTGVPGHTSEQCEKLLNYNMYKVSPWGSSIRGYNSWYKKSVCFQRAQVDLNSTDTRAQLLQLMYYLCSDPQHLQDTYTYKQRQDDQEERKYLNASGLNQDSHHTEANVVLLKYIGADTKKRGQLSPWSKVEHGIQMGTDDIDSTAYSLFPVPEEDQDDFDFYSSQETQDWSAKELDFAADKRNYPTLSPRYQELYKDLLGFFIPGDGLVSKSILRLLFETKRYSASAFLVMQLKIEMTHAEGYGQAVAAIIPDLKEQARVYKMIDDLPCVKAKGQFIKDLVDSNASAAERMLAAACSEGIFFVTLFAIIFYLRSKNVMETFIFLNQQVSADETLHRDYYCMKVRKLGTLTRDRALNIVKEAVDIEIEHMKYILRQPVDSEEQDGVLGLTVENLSNYARGLGDQVLVGAGEAPYYNVQIDLPWMTDMATVKRANFYERKVTGYRRMAKSDAVDWKTRIGGNLDDSTAIPQDADTLIVADPNSVDF